MMMATQKEAVAITSVFWDIKKCPVPPDFDARRVGPCIKRFVEKLGYSGPLTISAFGRLTDVPDEVLRAVSSTGIVLDAVPFGSNSLTSLLFRWVLMNPPPANLMMIISDSTNESLCDYLYMLQHDMGYNILEPYPYGPPQEAGWESFLLAESGALEEDKCIETGESVCSWVCSVCRGYPSGQGFDKLTTHLSSQEHARRKLDMLPSRLEDEYEYEDEDEDEYEDEYEYEEEELLLEAVEAGVKPQPK